VDRARNQLLARPRLARDQDRHIPHRGFRDRIETRAHGLAGAHQAAQVQSLPAAPPQVLDPIVHGAGHTEQQILDRAALLPVPPHTRSDGRLCAILVACARDDHDLWRTWRGLDVRDPVEAVPVRQGHVEQHHRGLEARQSLDPCAQGSTANRLVLGARHLFEHVRVLGVVIDNEYLAHGHRTDRTIVN
jgi:hypothetical protein